MENSIVEDWLRSLQLSHYSQSFIDNGYDDLEICKKIDDPDLDAIGVVNPVHRDRILTAVKILLEHGGTAVYFTLEESQDCSVLPQQCPEVIGNNDQCNDTDNESGQSSHSPSSSVSVCSGETHRACSDVSTTHSDPSAGSLTSKVPTFDVENLANEKVTHSDPSTPQNQLENSGSLVRIPRLQLKMLIRDRLVAEGIKLSSSPYTNPDGSQGFLEGLASRYAEQLRTHYQDVLERLGELWARMVVLETSKAHSPILDRKCADDSVVNSIYTPGIYSPSSCLSDHEEELIYGYTKYPPLFKNSSLRSDSPHKSYGSKAQTIYDSDGYYSIGFIDTANDSPSIKKKSGIGKFLKVLSSKKDKCSSKNANNKNQRVAANTTPSILAERINNIPNDTYSSYRFNSRSEDEKLRIMRLASDGRISVRTAIERVRMIDSDIRNLSQQENMEVLSSIRKSCDKLPASFQGHPYHHHHHHHHHVNNDSSLYSDIPSRASSAHFYDEPPYESDDSDDDNGRNRKKLRHRKCKQDKCKSGRPDNPSINVGDDSVPNESNNVAHRRCHRPNVNNRRLLHLVTQSGPNSPLHQMNCRSAANNRASSCTSSPLGMARNGRQMIGADYETSPVVSLRQRSSMISKIKQLASRSSLSAEEEVGCPPSSECEETKEDVETKNDALPSRTDSTTAKTTSIVGKMKGLRRDVKRKISRLRSNRGSESEVGGVSDYLLLNLNETDSSTIASMVLHQSSSVESLENETQESILSNQIVTTTTTTTTASSSNRSSASTEDDRHNGCHVPIVARAQALVDCTPSPYDRDALNYKKGQIIDVISMDQSGIWKGRCDDRIGTFKFINVKVVEQDRRRNRGRHHNRKRYSKKSKPKSVEELLRRINLEQYISVFMLNGYENLELFQDIEEEDLDYLGIDETDHRAKLLTAAELLHDYSELTEQNQCSDVRKTSQPAVEVSQMESSVSFDTVFKYKQSPHDSGCFASSENVRKEIRGGGGVVCDRTASPPTVVDSGISQSESGMNSSEGTDCAIVASMNNLDVTVTGEQKEQQPDVINNFNDSSALEKYGNNASSRTATSSDEKTEVGPIQSDIRSAKKKIPPPIPIRSVFVVDDDRRDFLCSTSSQQVDYYLWNDGGNDVVVKTARPIESNRKSSSKSSKNKKSKGLELNLAKKASGSRMYKKSCGDPNVNQDENSNHSVLIGQVVNKLNAEGIDLSSYPYTDKTGFCGIPPALVQRYTEEMNIELHTIAKLLDRIRIVQLKKQGRVGVPNDFLVDSCSSPVIDVNCSSLNAWLISVGLPMYYEGFHEIGFDDLHKCCSMTETELKICHVYDGRHLQRFIDAIEALRFSLLNN